jgi:hypothetical protein
MKNDKIQVGDKVQWESDGACRFESPKKVTAISECGKWAFVEGTKTGLPISELHKIEEELL